MPQVDLTVTEGQAFPAYYEDLSDTPCPDCKGLMTRGEEECAGICFKCYERHGAEMKRLEREYERA